MEYETSKSSVFRFWVSGNDAYLSIRNATNLIKVSFHESGVSLIGKDKQRWKLKARVKAKHDPNWEIVGALDFPSLNVDPLTIPKVAAHEKGIAIKSAPIGHSVTFTIYCSAHATSQLPFADVNDSIGPFPMRSGGTFWIVTNLSKLNDSESLLIDKYKAEAIFQTNDEQIPPLDTCLLWVSHGYPYPMIIVIPMDKLNFKGISNAVKPSAPEGRFAGKPVSRP